MLAYPPSTDESTLAWRTGQWQDFSESGGCLGIVANNASTFVGTALPPLSGTNPNYRIDFKPGTLTIDLGATYITTVTVPLIDVSTPTSTTPVNAINFAGDPMGFGNTRRQGRAKRDPAVLPGDGRQLALPAP